APGSKEEPVWNHDETIRTNVFAANTHAQVWGWWDVDDDRHWPASSPHRSAIAKDGQSLEALRITFVSNLYDPPAGRPAFRWGVEWKTNRAYDSLESLRADLGFEQGGRIGRFVARDAIVRDLRVAADSPAVALGAYPQGDVPGVRLGTHESTDAVRAA